MIQKSGDYYSFDESVSSEKIGLANVSVSRNDQQHVMIGNVKERIQNIRERFQQIKKQRQSQQNALESSNKESIFKKVSSENNQTFQQIDIQLYIPEQILKLDEKISLIQQKLNPNEIFRAKMQQKGTLVERVKLLHQKLKSILEKSSEIIVSNIQNYCSSLDDKQEYLKIMFLRSAHSKIKGMKQQILVLESYLNNLKQIQTKIKSTEPIQKTIECHSQIIEIRNNLSKKIKELFSSMKKTYQEILNEIDAA